MPITPEGPAEATARREAERWLALSSAWREETRPELWADLPPIETAIIPSYDPGPDLRRRMESWGYEPGRLDLADLTRFAAGLARAEAEAWASGLPDIATRAYQERRFLVGDRIVPWAVPWLDTAGRCHPRWRQEAGAGRDELLALADRLRPSPALSGVEGLVLPGHDGFGPLTATEPLPRFLLSLWSGAVVMRATLASLRGELAAVRRIDPAWLAEARFVEDLASLYEVAAGRWRALAASRQGTGRIWLDLAERARGTAARLRA